MRAEINLHIVRIQSADCYFSKHVTIIVSLQFLHCKRCVEK